MTVVRHIVIHGCVQGVGYRAFVEQQALRRGIEGWVRNCRDGTVEALLKGAEAAVADTIEACRRGPFAARVDALDQRKGNDADLKARRLGEVFSVLPTV